MKAYTGDTEITAAPEIVAAVPARKEVAEIMLSTLFNRGMIASYLSNQFGSHWYVEIPRHLNELYEEIGEVAVQDVFNGLLDDNDHLWSVIEGKYRLP